MTKNPFVDELWTINHLNEIKRKAGGRYTPKLNVELPISEIFDGISRNINFYRLIRIHTGKLNQEFKSLSSNYDNLEIQKLYKSFAYKIKNILTVLSKIKEYETAIIPWNRINKYVNESMEMSWKFIEELRKEKDKAEKDEANKKNIVSNTSTSIDYTSQRKLSEVLSCSIHEMNDIQKELRFFDQFSSSTTAKLSNNPFLLLTGLPGSGKTHLLCDLVERRTLSTVTGPSVMLFGEYFGGKTNVWDIIINQLKFGNGFTKERFLKSLSKAGQQKKTRSLIVVDALNESIPISFWKKNLPRLLKEIKKYPDVALVVSVRNGFEVEVLSNGSKKAFIEEEHRGFEFREWEAIAKFFKEFSLPLPEIPILLPEFQNPLFLLLFCIAFNKRSKQNGNKKKQKLIFRGHEGATYIFENFVKTIADKIAKKFNIKQGRNSKNEYVIWDTVIEKIAEEMVAENKDRIPEQKLLDIINHAHPTVNSNEFAISLEKNLLLVKVPRYSPSSDQVQGFDYRFPFQKFSDHLIGRYLFKKYRASNKTPKQFFSSHTKIGKFIKTSWNRGIVEALAILCPEQLNGKEFFEIAPYVEEWIIVETFIESILWRRPTAFAKDLKSVFRMINNTIIHQEGWHGDLLNALLTITAVPEHPLNALFLHRNLERTKMPERDAWWSTFLHYQYGEHKAVDRLIEWASNFRDNKNVKEESIKLYSISLVWFLTTSNRFVRDKATKALINLLTDHLNIIKELLETFNNVDDLYILERLYAVAYGCGLRNSNDQQGLRDLATWFLSNIFKKGKVPIHILMRDYASGVVEVAISRGLIDVTQKVKITPPFGSKWPQRVPSIKYLRKKYYPENYFKDRTKDRGYLDIWSSLMYHEGSLADFGRYVVDSALGHWSGRKLNGGDPNREKILENFKKKLNPHQLELFDKTNPYHGIDVTRIIFRSYKKEKDQKTLDAELKLEREKERQTFIKTIKKFKESLPINKKKYFEKEIEPFLDERGSINDPLEQFDTGLGQRWIFNRVIKLGWSSKLHGGFDNNIGANRIDRTDHKSERIGKKYQWIAFHQFLALVADHFEFKGDRWEDKKYKFEGCWQLYLRDIDPSCTLTEKPEIAIGELPTISNYPVRYSLWQQDQTLRKWLKNHHKLPNPKSILEIVGEDGKRWLVLEGMVEWQEETPPEFEKYRLPTRTLYYMTKSYLVKKKNKNKIISWAKKQSFYNRWMPESHEFYNVFLGEYPNLPAFLWMYIPYYHHNEWTNNGDRKEIPAKILVTDDEYLSSGSSYDCSTDEAIRVKLPAKWLIDKMELRQKYLDGRFYDKQDDLVVFDLGIISEGLPSLLLIQKDKLTSFLKKEKCDIFWTLLGEKETIGGGGTGQPYGWSEINGVYYLDNNNTLEGSIKAKFHPPIKYQTSNKSIKKK